MSDPVSVDNKKPSSDGGVPATSLSDLPRDELARYGAELGLQVSASTPQGELVRLVRERQELLVQLDRDSMLDIVKWARLPVRQSATKEQLAREIAAIASIRYDDLSDRGLRTLALLRGLPVADGDSRHTTISRLKKAETIGQWFARKRRSIVGKLVSKYIEGQDESDSEYQFLPEDRAGKAVSIRQEIEERGIMTSLANRLRGAADDYIQTKMDEIEIRIDRKLDQIDKRLQEWRDREVANRLRILRITLIASVIVAILSLGYRFIAVRYVEQPSGTRPAVAVE